MIPQSMTASKIILLNGPKECGKNVAVDYLKKTMGVVDKRCKDHLFVVTAALFRMTLEEFFVHYEDRETKEEPNKAFAITTSEYNKLALITGQEVYQLFSEALIRISVREALMYASEIVCKPAFGEDYFGVARADSIDLTGQPVWAIDDSTGFDEEIPPVIEKLGMENVLLIRIHGRGSFEGDSRKYISDGVVASANVLDYWNTGTEEGFLRDINEVALDFYKG